MGQGRSDGLNLYGIKNLTGILNSIYIYIVKKREIGKSEDDHIYNYKWGQSIKETCE